jgi:hypothetical protein
MGAHSLSRATTLERPCQENMRREFWKRDIELEETIPPVLVGVPGALLGIAVPFLPRPGKLFIIVPYTCEHHADPVSVRGMRWACRIDEAA